MFSENYGTFWLFPCLNDTDETNGKFYYWLNNIFQGVFFLKPMKQIGNSIFTNFDFWHTLNQPWPTVRPVLHHENRFEVSYPEVRYWYSPPQSLPQAVEIPTFSPFTFIIYICYAVTVEETEEQVVGQNTLGDTQKRLQSTRKYEII